MSPIIIILCLFAAMLGVNMLFAKNPITSALSLLGVLLCTAGIYGVIGEHMVATIQLVVYAGAIMVLFVFSIMLLNLNKSELDYKKNPKMFYPVLLLGMLLFGLVGYGILDFFNNHSASRQVGVFTPEAIEQLGGNTRVLSHALFSQFYLSFEFISLALLVAVVGAVVLAKRKVD